MTDAGGDTNNPNISHQRMISYSKVDPNVIFKF